MQEFYFKNQGHIPADAIPQNIVSSSDGLQNIKYLISNTNEVDSLVFAPEVDFYLQNSQDISEQKIKTLSAIYETRALRYDFGNDKEYEKNVTNSLLVISTKEQFDELKNLFSSDFETIFCDESEAKELNGEIGSFELKKVNKLFREETLKSSQVLITKEDGQKELFVGVERVGDVAEAKKRLLDRVGSYTYKKVLKYDSTVCQYHHRREHICAACSSVCPTLGVKHDDATRELVYSTVNCIACGECISVCPSGSLESSSFGVEAVTQVARLCEGKKILIVSEKDIGSLDVALPQGVFPLAIESVSYLTENSLITLLQESGAQIVLFSKKLTSGTKDAIFIINQIWQKRFGKDGILVASEKETLNSVLEKQDFCEGSSYKSSIKHKTKRAELASRLQFLVGSRELGSIECGEVISYGEIRVDEDKCTLCLSCVGACNTDALRGDEATLSLRFNPSLCTNCGYCIATCPEKCMSLEGGHIELAPKWFEYEELAKDELFKCVECGKPFATSKSVLKISNMLSAAFSSDPNKLKSLYCCGDCKPKIMLKDFAEEIYRSRNAG